jgi:Tfp pilus assembly protein PilF
MKTIITLICLLFVTGCTSRESIKGQVYKDEAEYVELYKNATRLEVIDVLKQYLSKADEYDARGWKEEGIRTDALRAMVEARVAAVYRDIGQPEESESWIRLAVEHQHMATGSTNATADGLLLFVDTLDKNIDPLWRKEIGQQPVPGYRRQEASQPDP